jgi:hypothetical protein
VFDIAVVCEEMKTKQLLDCTTGVYSCDNGVQGDETKQFECAIGDVDSFNNGIHWPCDNNKRTTQFM